MLLGCSVTEHKIPGVRVCINGSRKLSDQHSDKLIETLDVLYEEVDVWDYVITGGAKGADEIGKKWAISKGLNHHEMPARWMGGKNKLAGKERNWRMVKALAHSMRPVLVTAWDGMSPGTANMIAACCVVKIPVIPVVDLQVFHAETYIEPTFGSGIIV